MLFLFLCLGAMDTTNSEYRIISPNSNEVNKYFHCIYVKFTVDTILLRVLKSVTCKYVIWVCSVKVVMVFKWIFPQTEMSESNFE